MDPNFIGKGLPFPLSRRLKQTRVGEVVMWVDLNDHIGYRFYMDGAFDSQVEWIAKSLGLVHGDILLDIGANVGTVCIPLAKSLGLEIIAIEASRLNGSLLSLNSSINEVKVKIHLECMVDPETSQLQRWLTLRVPSGNSGASSLVPGWSHQEAPAAREIVSTSTVNSVLHGVMIDRIKLIKLDVEGAEGQVIKGADCIREGNIPVLFEYNWDNTNEGRQKACKELLELLSPQYVFYAISKSLSLETFSPTRRYSCVLAYPRKFDLSEIDHLIKAV